MALKLSQINGGNAVAFNPSTDVVVGVRNVSNNPTDQLFNSVFVNSVSNADSSLTISPTTGTVVASLNLGKSNTWTIGQTVNVANIGASSTDGFSLTNTTAAANNAQQWSPRLRLTGNGWTGSASAALDWIIENRPVQVGTNTEYGTLAFAWQQAGGGYTDFLTFNMPITTTVGLSAPLIQSTATIAIGTTNGVATIYGARFNFATSGTNTLAAVRGFAVQLAAGATPSLFSTCFYAQNAMAGTNTGSMLGTANTGVYGQASGITAGHNVGGYFSGNGSSTFSIGSVSSSQGTGSVGIGATGIASGSTDNVGGYFAVSTGSANPVLTGLASGIVVDNGGTAAAIAIFQNNAVTKFQIDTNNNVVIGSAALSTGATNGFLYIETCAGTPAGTPTAYTGRAALVYDSTNNKLAVYNGAWKQVTLA